jgi:hypothetical protein
MFHRSEDHVGARLGFAGLDQADVASRDIRSDREIQLSESPALSPLPQEFPDRVHDHGAYSSLSRMP